MGSKTSTLGELFLDATREVIEKSRIKAQMLRLERIMETDRSRLTAVYAQIGKLYIEGTLLKNKSKANFAMKEIKHLKLRLERAEERYEQLKEAHSVDECKEAFRSELSAKIKQAQDNTAITAYKAKKKAQDVISGKAPQVATRIKGKAVSVAGSIKSKTSAPVKKSKKNSYLEENEDLSYLELLAELDEEGTTIAEDIDLTPDAEVKEILDNLDALIAEVEETLAETPIDDEVIPAAADITDEASDDESAESFDF
ncbi:MAG: hypothetical protein E7566_01460 [Ruminococcaceae bacterium]|nr:hypothetical protein [Oscillospiraceae bacterium]